MEHTHTVFVLQGGAHVGPQEWWARSIRCPALSAPDAAKTPGARDEAKVAVLSVIVGGLRGLSSSERSREERKYRDAVSKMRSCMFHLLRSGKLAPATLPVSIEVERESLGETGALGGLIEERLSAVVKAAAGGAGGAGAGTDAGSGMGTGAETGAGRARGKKRPRVLPKAPKRIKVVGKRSWMGTAVLRRHMAGIIPQPPRSHTASKEVTEALSLSSKERSQVQLLALRRSDGMRYRLPPASDAGEAPFAPSAVEGREVGRITAIDCWQDMEAREGEGSLLVKGGDVSQCIKETASMTRAFIRLHLGWLTQWLGKPPVRDPASANVQLHLVSAAQSKEGVSIGLAMTPLVCWFWDVRPCHDRAASTGEASLCGELSPVHGLRDKALGACGVLTALTRDEAGGVRVRHRACLLVPKENTRDGIVVESLNSIDDAATFPVQVPCGVKDRLSVLAVSSLFEAITLMFPRSSPAPTLAQPPPRPLDSLAVARFLFTNNDGGACQVIECALLEGGTGKRTYTGNIKKSVSDSIEAGLMWLRRYWDEDIVGCYRGGAIHHRPADQDYDLHFNLPSSALQDDPSTACSALVAVLSLLFRRPAPADVVVMAEVRMSGCLWPREGVDDSILLPLAEANGVRKIVTLRDRAKALRSLQQQKPDKFQEIEVVGVDDMLGVMEAVFGTQVIQRNEEAEE